MRIRPPVDVEESRHQIAQGRLAAAGGTDERHRLAAPHRQIDSGKDLFLLVAERDVLEVDLVRQIRRGDRARAVLHLAPAGS